MNYKIDNKLIYVLSGGLLFNFLFWKEELALNLVIYSLFLVTIYLISNKLLDNKKVVLIVLSHVFAGILLLVNHSVLTIVTWYISLFILIGYFHNVQLRSIFTALIAAFLQFASSPVNLFKRITAIEIGGFSFKPALKLIQYLIIPSFILLLFSIIYSIANPVFDSYLGNFFENLESFFNTVFTFFFKDISIDRIAFLAVGLLFSTGLFISFKNKLEKMESGLHDKLLRVRHHKKQITIWKEISNLFLGNLANKKMALKTENTIAIISFAGLNLLLLFLNGIDITTLWMGDLGSLNFSQALHGSTNALIISIVMAMAVILYFFNGNLNFYRKSKTIRFLAYGWILQNTFLILSVLLRDYHYIAMHGLTYKRIGVIVFSLLCVIGLLTVYWKVAKQKSLFYLFKTNGAIWYVLLLASGLINWDVYIVKYNIENRNGAVLDVSYLMSLSDKTLPSLIENKELLKKYLSPNTSPYSYTANVMEGPLATTSVKKPVVDSIEIKKQIKQSLVQNFNESLAKRTVKFNEKRKKTTWLSWNYRDWLTYTYLNQH
ncbi:DUF4173 domain-containing protein [Pedobacter sp. Du54]|uniref:DUF4153 domain-containing protein n=1 Tax=Pedobacter anseongensis TaxID=3133439 RepID=UPI0030A1BD05